MKRIIPLLLITMFLCAACAEKTPKRPPTIPFEAIDWEHAGAYKDKYILSHDRIENQVRYIDDLDALIDKAVNAARERMQTAYEKGELPWDGYAVSETDLYAFAGNGCYISKIPVATYCNNINMLLDRFSLAVFNEDMSVQAEIDIENLSSARPEIHFNTNQPVPAAAKEFPDMEFIKINIYDPPRNTTMLLGEDNQLYGLSDEAKARYTVDGDVFRSLPEELRFSYNQIVDQKNLIWVEYGK